MKLSIVSYLDPSASAAIRELQQQLANITNSSAALSSWAPHITIGDGIEVDEESLPNVIKQFQQLASTAPAFDLHFAEFSHFDNWQAGDDKSASPYVLYVKPQLNDNLVSLVHEIEGIAANFPKWYHMPVPYAPHCTLAYLDLTVEGYKSGIRYLATHPITVFGLIDHISLVEKRGHDNNELVRLQLNQNQAA